MTEKEFLKLKNGTKVIRKGPSTLDYRFIQNKVYIVEKVDGNYVYFIGVGRTFRYDYFEILNKQTRLPDWF